MKKEFILVEPKVLKKEILGLINDVDIFTDKLTVIKSVKKRFNFDIELEKGVYVEKKIYKTQNKKRKI